ATSSCASSISASARTLRPYNSAPASVRLKRRVVRFNNRAPSFSSSRVTALLTTGCDISSASAAAVKLESSTTLTKMAISVREFICEGRGAWGLGLGQEHEEVRARGLGDK